MGTWLKSRNLPKVTQLNWRWGLEESSGKTPVL